MRLSWLEREDVVRAEGQGHGTSNLGVGSSNLSERATSLVVEESIQAADRVFVNGE